MQNGLVDLLVVVIALMIFAGSARLRALRNESRREALTKEQFRNSIAGQMDDLVVSLLWLTRLAEERGLTVTISVSDGYGEGWFSFVRKIVFMGIPPAENGSTCAAEMVLSWRSDQSGGRQIIVKKSGDDEGQSTRMALVDIEKAADAVEAHIRELCPPVNVPLIPYQ